MCACVCLHFYICVYVYIYISLFFLIYLLYSLPLRNKFFTFAWMYSWTIGGNGWTEWRSMTFFQIFLFLFSWVFSRGCRRAPTWRTTHFLPLFALFWQRATPGLSSSTVKKVSFCTLVYTRATYARGGRVIHERKFVLIHDILFERTRAQVQTFSCLE